MAEFGVYTPIYYSAGQRDRGKNSRPPCQGPTNKAPFAKAKEGPKAPTQARYRRRGPKAPDDSAKQAPLSEKVFNES